MLEVFTTRRQWERYLNLVGYMFEQSIPLRGIAYRATLTTLEPYVLLHKCLVDAPLDKVVCHG